MIWGRLDGQIKRPVHTDPGLVTKEVYGNIKGERMLFVESASDIFSNKLSILKTLGGQNFGSISSASHNDPMHRQYWGTLFSENRYPVYQCNYSGYLFIQHGAYN